MQDDEHSSLQGSLQSLKGTGNLNIIQSFSVFFMHIQLADLSSTAIYHLMTQTIIPRPIAWVLSKNTNASYNLAPFSYFNAVCSDPPLMMLSMGKKPNGENKDTVANLSVGEYCVIHIAHSDQADLVTATAATLDYGQSEVTENAVELMEQSDWPLPRVRECSVAYLGKIHSTQLIGNTPQTLVFVEAVSLYVDDALTKQINNRLAINATKMNPLARLGASQYASLGEVFSKARPK